MLACTFLDAGKIWLYNVLGRCLYDAVSKQILRGQFPGGSGPGLQHHAARFGCSELVSNAATEWKLERKKERRGLLPVRGLNSLKTDGRSRFIPCHADVVEDLVRRVAAPATKTEFY